MHPAFINNYPQHLPAVELWVSFQNYRSFKKCLSHTQCVILIFLVLSTLLIWSAKSIQGKYNNVIYEVFIIPIGKWVKCFKHVWIIANEWVFLYQNIVYYFASKSRTRIILIILVFLIVVEIFVKIQRLLSSYIH